MPIVYTTSNGVEIHVEPGKKSPNDFIVKYRGVGRARLRTPQHVHLVVDFFAKRTGNLEHTNAMLDHIINDVILEVQPAVDFPPHFQVFDLETARAYEGLNQYGEYSAEFLLAITELIMIQERTNYPQGTMNLRLFQKLRDGRDIFAIVSAATFGGRR